VQAVPREVVRGEEGINKQICLAVSCVQPVFSAPSCIFAIPLPALKPPSTLLFEDLKNIKTRYKPKGIQRKGWSKKKRQHAEKGMLDKEQIKNTVTSMSDL
jgi:hypothetical protein